MTESFENFVIVELHKHLNYIGLCCDLLNEEWPRNANIRLNYLKESCNGFPTSLILLHNNQLIAHCRLTSVLTKPKACFISSVVVWKCMRGRGHGSRIMKGAELYVSQMGISDIYLTTHDRCSFYTRLGYVHCHPVPVTSSASSSIRNKIKMLMGRMPTPDGDVKDATKVKRMSKYEDDDSNLTSKSSNPPALSPNIPAPPTLPTSVISIFSDNYPVQSRAKFLDPHLTSDHNDVIGQFWMMKRIEGV